MEKEAYVNFEIAKMLKEKGFDWECNGYFQIPKLPFGNPEKINKVLHTLPKKWNSYNKECVVYESISIPTHQMALKWLREEHKIHIDVFIGTNESYDTDGIMVDEWHFWTYYITNTIGDIIYDAYNEFDVIEYQTYEEAVEAALKHALEHLL